MNGSYNTQHQCSGTPRPGDVVMIEIDLRDKTPAKRTAHLFVRGIQQKPFASGLPPSVRFGVTLQTQNDSLEFVEYALVNQPKHTSLPGENTLTPS